MAACDLDQGLDPFVGGGWGGQLDGVAVADDVGWGVDCDCHFGGFAIGGGGGGEVV